MHSVDHSGEQIHDLVDELDHLLGRDRPDGPDSQAEADSAAVQRRYTRGLPTWAALMLITACLAGGGWLLLHPGPGACTYSRDVCTVERLDIDALRLAIPDSELMALLPALEILDPEDTMTTGEVFELEEYAHLDLEELLSPEEVERLLEYLD